MRWVFRSLALHVNARKILFRHAGPLRAGVFGWAAACCMTSWAASVYYTALVDGELKTSNLNIREVQGVQYVSLPALARQLGGTYRVTPVRITVDMAGTNASVGLNDIRVEGPRGVFSLKDPVLLQENDVLIAVPDIPLFFSQGLQVGLQGAGAAGTVSEPQTPAPELAPSPPPADTRVEVRDLTVAEPADEQLLKQMPALEPVNRPAQNEGESLPERPATTGPVQVIILDPGHGGADGGMTGSSGLLEKDLALALAVRVRDRLKQLSDVKVVLTREEDKDKSVSERSTLANQQKGDLLISIHAGAGYSPTARGVEVFCAAPAGQGSAVRQSYQAPSLRFAKSVAAEMAAQTGAPDRGVHEIPLLVLREAAMPGILVEVGCLNNPEEAAALAAEDYQAKLAEGMAQGIAKGRTRGTAP